MAGIRSTKDLLLTAPLFGRHGSQGNCGRRQIPKCVTPVSRFPKLRDLDTQDFYEQRERRRGLTAARVVVFGGDVPESITGGDLDFMSG
jgi:hypothetical protein